MAEKLWGGRYSKCTDKSVEDFTESISFDYRLAKYDIMGSVAHAKMLSKCGIISVREKEAIIKGLNNILKKIEAGSFVFDPALEDVHMNIENALTKMAGDAGAKLHTARSRNDQVALDMRLYLRDETGKIVDLISGLQKSILGISSKYKKEIISGWTHMQHAQPVLFAHHMLAYVEMFERDKERLEDCLKRINILPLGSCALAGTGLPIDRQFAAKELNFAAVSQNSMDAVSDRDFALEFLSAAAILGMHLSRMGEEFVLWAGPEFNLIEIDDAFCTGSSIMPQKKNPDVAELVRGKTGRLYGNLINLLVIMKGLPLSYNRDMQEDKVPVFDSVETIESALSVFAKMIENTKLISKPLFGFKHDFSYATDIAEYLVKKNIPFRKAHKIVGELVAYCITKDVEADDLDINTLKKFAKEFGNDVYKVMKVENCVSAKRSAGGTAYSNIEKALKHWLVKINSNK